MEVEDKNQGHTSAVKFIQKYFSIGAILNELLCFESSLLYRNVVAFYIFTLKLDWICLLLSKDFEVLQQNTVEGNQREYGGMEKYLKFVDCKN